MSPSFFIIQPSSAEPIFRQIADQVRRLIAGGHLEPNALLPSVREIAGHHAINPMTVSRAYSLLEAEGVLERVRGKGMAVATRHQKPQSREQRLALLEQDIQALSRKARELELPASLVAQRLRSMMEEP